MGVARGGGKGKGKERKGAKVFKHSWEKKTRRNALNEGRKKRERDKERKEKGAKFISLLSWPCPKLKKGGRRRGRKTVPKEKRKKKKKKEGRKI